MFKYFAKIWPINLRRFYLLKFLKIYFLVPQFHNIGLVFYIKCGSREALSDHTIGISYVKAPFLRTHRVRWIFRRFGGFQSKPSKLDGQLNWWKTQLPLAKGDGLRLIFLAAFTQRRGCLSLPRTACPAPNRGNLIKSNELQIIKFNFNSI